ncbi:glyoxalase family protein [Penicillium riverlandense]|uniref:glyoxalase family protein n=1 Tax=Penicillium riverlandense TaxID=1903569 RepID=UPI002546FEAF|nr:glyoxalase family protein [Penicillium riverlandense]KAJ5811737.1 glyoxalase family protein [Penicillium riverlandense]
MSKEDTTAVELLTKIGTIVLTIETNLHHNRLDRKTIRRLLREYSARAESDGRLMNAAREDPDCANRGLFLAYAHMELVTWLGKNNYTIPSSSIQWYSWKQFLSKYRLPPFWSSSYTSDLRSQLDNIERTAALVCADLQAHNVSLKLLDNLWTSSHYREDFDPGHRH